MLSDLNTIGKKIKISYLCSIFYLLVVFICSDLRNISLHSR